MDTEYLVIFDIDSTLNNFFEMTYGILNLNHKLPLRIKYYSSQCSEITADEAEAMERLWHDPEFYLQCEPVQGVEALEFLAEVPNVRVVMHSLCYSHEVAEAKRVWSNRHVRSDKITLNLEVGTKIPISDKNAVIVVVEDNLEYLSECEAEHKLLLDKVYNAFENYSYNTDNIVRKNSLVEALDYIYELIGIYPVR